MSVNRCSRRFFQSSAWTTIRTWYGYYSICAGKKFAMLLQYWTIDQLLVFVRCSTWWGFSGFFKNLLLDPVPEDFFLTCKRNMTPAVFNAKFLSLCLNYNRPKPKKEFLPDISILYRVCTCMYVCVCIHIHSGLYSRNISKAAYLHTIIYFLALYTSSSSKRKTKISDVLYM